MKEGLRQRVIAFIESVYDMEPLDDDGNETPLGYEALELLDALQNERG